MKKTHIREYSARHATFSIARVYDAPVDMVFRAWSDKEAKARWFAPPVEWKDVVRVQDFRVGGRDRTKGTWPDGHTTDFNAEYLDIVANQRIVYVYEMHKDEVKISVSLATVEFRKAGAGTKLTVTEQGVFLDDYDDAGSREEGTNMLLDKLGASLRPA